MTNIYGNPMTKEDDIAVIVVNWNGWQDTLNCLRSLRDSLEVVWHFIYSR